jgi:proton glutamate symport protein
MLPVHAPPASPLPRTGFRPSLGQVMFAAALLGVAIGWCAPDVGARLGWVADVFLRLVRMLGAPLLFGVLVPAIANAGHAQQVGRLGWRSLVVFEVGTTIALLIGWGVGALVQPGAGIALHATTASPSSLPVRDLFVNAVPTSIVDAMARGDVLQIVVFCLVFGVAALAVGELARPVVVLAESVAAITFRCTRYVMWLAPPAVCAALAVTVASSGSPALAGLTQFVGAVWAAEIATILVMALVVVWTGVPWRRFASCAREPFVIGFATASSAAALPQVLDGLRRLGVSPSVVGFVAPLSMTLHMNGSAAYMGVAMLFVVQAAGLPLPLSTQVLLLITLKLAGKGVTGVPRATVIILAAISDGFGLPAAGVAMLLGIDALIDPIRTAANVTSHCVSPALVGRWEGERYGG